MPLLIVYCLGRWLLAFGLRGQELYRMLNVIGERVGSPAGDAPKARSGRAACGDPRRAAMNHETKQRWELPAALMGSFARTSCEAIWLEFSRDFSPFGGLAEDRLLANRFLGSGKLRRDAGEPPAAHPRK